MALLYNFIIGLVTAMLGVVPPGLLNMSAAKISMNEGRKKALLFSVGVCVTVMVQTYVALLFARYIQMHPEIVDILQKVALGIFICLTVYFLFIAKDTRREIPENTHHSKTNRFFNGMFLGVLNLLPLPYWVYVSITFSGFGWFSLTQVAIIIACLASGIGTFLTLWLYVQFFRPKEERKRPRVNMNTIIGSITLAIALITFFRIIHKL